MNARGTDIVQPQAPYEGFDVARPTLDAVISAALGVDDETSDRTDSETDSNTGREADRQAEIRTESKTDGQFSDIIHLTKVKTGCVAIGRRLSYATRLKILLNTLNRVRQCRTFKSPLDRLPGPHALRWLLIDDDTRLLFTGEFAHSGETHLRLLAEVAPNLLDLIWTHTENYEWGMAADLPRFSQWVRGHQIDTAGFSPGSAQAVVPDFDGWTEETDREYAHIEEAFGSLRAFFASEEMPLFEAALQEFLGPSWFEYKAQKNHQRASETWPHQQPGAEILPSAPPPDDRKTPAPRISPEDLAQIQGNVLSGYESLMHGQMLFFRIDVPEAAFMFLRRLAARVTTARVTTSEGEPGEVAVNVCVSCAGFKALGFADDVLLALPDAFRQGMSGRARVVGDGGVNLPEHWLPPLRETSDRERILLETVHLVVFVYASTLDGLASETDRISTDACDGGMMLLGRETAERRKNVDGDDIEPFFGFIDDVRQPRIEGQRGPTRWPGDSRPVKLGKFVLGHAADHTRVSLLPKLDALGLRDLYANGSFLAIRKLARLPSVEAWKDREEIELLLGRRSSADPLVAGGADAPHVLRRAVAYRSGEGAATDEGLFFIAFSASLARQYEVLQTRINNVKASGEFSAAIDTIAGTNGTDSLVSYCDRQGELRTVRLPPFVKLLWGLYLFEPSKKALENMRRYVDVDLRKEITGQGPAHGAEATQGEPINAE